MQLNVLESQWRFWKESVLHCHCRSDANRCKQCRCGPRSWAYAEPREPRVTCLCLRTAHAGIMGLQDLFAQHLKQMGRQCCAKTCLVSRPVQVKPAHMSKLSSIKTTANMLMRDTDENPDLSWDCSSHLCLYVSLMSSQTGSRTALSCISFHNTSSLLIYNPDYIGSYETLVTQKVHIHSSSKLTRYATHYRSTHQLHRLI